MKWQDYANLRFSDATVGSFRLLVHRAPGTSSGSWSGGVSIEGRTLFDVGAEPTRSLAKKRVEKELGGFLTGALNELKN